jgi:DNA modification methylase
MGSGSCGVAAIKLDRKFIGIEQEQNYFDISVKRINLAKEGFYGNLKV